MFDVLSIVSRTRYTFPTKVYAVMKYFSQKYQSTCFASDIILSIFEEFMIIIGIPTCLICNAKYRYSCWILQNDLIDSLLLSLYNMAEMVKNSSSKSSF